MTLKEFYAAIGGDYEGVVSRLYSEQLVKKFLIKFLADGSYDTLASTLQSGDYKEAFRAAHTLKGVCQNLGFSKFFVSSSNLTEALRHESGGYAALMEKVTEDYTETVKYLKELEKSEN